MSMANMKIVIPVIQKLAKKNGVPFASPIIAQAILESGWNTSKLSRTYHNYFGMKCGSSWKGKSVNMTTWEEYSGKSVQIKDNFRAYDSVEAGIQGYFEFIGAARYKRLFKATSPEEYCDLLKECGWATASQYSKSLKNIITTYNLKQYDIEAPEYEVGKTYTLQVNLNVRELPSIQSKLVPFDKLTKDGQKHCRQSGLSILKTGTKVTCKQICRDSEGNIWIKIPSGYVSAYYKNNIYIL